jgi:hypothetical protein
MIEDRVISALLAVDAQNDIRVMNALLVLTEDCFLDEDAKDIFRLINSCI